MSETERDERLRGIQERAAAATEGPWLNDRGDYRVLGYGDNIAEDSGTQPADAAFIAAARTDVPWLLAEVARLDAVVTAVRDVVDTMHGADQRDLHNRLLRALDGA